MSVSDHELMLDNFLLRSSVISLVQKDKDWRFPKNVKYIAVTSRTQSYKSSKFGNSGI